MRLLPLTNYQNYQRTGVNNKQKLNSSPKTFKPTFKGNHLDKEAGNLYKKYQDLFDFLENGEGGVKNNFEKIMDYARDVSSAKKLKDILAKHYNGEKYNLDLSGEINQIKSSQNVPLLGNLLKTKMDTRSKIIAVDKIGELGDKTHIDLIRPFEDSLENYYSHTETEYFTGSMNEMYPEGEFVEIYEFLGSHAKKAIENLMLKK